MAAIEMYILDIIQLIKFGYNDQVLRVLNQPIGPSAFEILRFFRTSEDMIIESDSELQHQATLSLEIFAYREKDMQGTDNANYLLIELQRIHNKSIFDTFNEALDYSRPFGVKGRPLPWKVNQLSIIIKQRPFQIQRKNLQIKDLYRVLMVAMKRVLGWSEILFRILIPSSDSKYNSM